MNKFNNQLNFMLNNLSDSTGTAVAWKKEQSSVNQKVSRLIMAFFNILTLMLKFMLLQEVLFLNLSAALVMRLPIAV